MGDWQLWKLHTVWDYLFFFLILAAGYAVYRVAVGGLNRNRNLHGQVPRVEKKMKKVLGPETVCFREGSLKTEEGELPFDILCVSSDRVYTVKVFPFGLKVRGGANVPQWQFSDNRETRKEQNPVPGLRNLKNALNKVFTQEGLKNIPVEPLIVFSDNWGSTKFYLEGINYAVGFTRLSDYLKKQPKKIAGRIDSKAVCAALEKRVKKGGPV